MSQNPNNKKKVYRVWRNYNTRLQNRLSNFSGNREVEVLEEPIKTPKIRKQRGRPRKKNLAVEPLSNRPLYTTEMDDNNNNNDDRRVEVGAGEVSFDQNGIEIEENAHRRSLPSNYPVDPINQNPPINPNSTGARRKTNEYRLPNLPSSDPVNLNKQNRTNILNPWENLDLNYRPNRDLSFENIQKYIDKAQEKSMNEIMKKFENLLTTHFNEPNNPNKNQNNRKKNGNYRHYQPSETFNNRKTSENRDILDKEQENIPWNRNKDHNSWDQNRRNSSWNQNRISLSSPLATASRSEESARENQNYFPKVQLDKWSIKFDGSSIEEFWFKVECCKESSPYTWDQVFKNFHCLLSERIQRWFWMFRENNRNANIQLLRSTMLDTFRSRDTDLDIWSLMMKRKQRIGESFGSFWKDMEELSWRFKTSRSPEEIIQVLRANMLPEISLALTVYETNSLSKFLDKCMEADKNLKLYSHFYNRYPKKINELELENIEENSLEALKFQYKKKEDRPNFNNKREVITCANCDSEEHRWRDCPVERQRTFCYKCCLQGVTTPRCPNCSPNPSENRKNSG